MTQRTGVLVAALGLIAGLAACSSQDATAPATPLQPGARGATHAVVVTPTPLVAAQRVGFGLPSGQVVAPNTPGGGVVVGKYLYTGDAVNGFRHWMPVDTTNPDPVNNGILVFDPDFSRSLGGTELCVLFCAVGQIAYDGVQTVYVTAYDHAKGQPGSLTMPGVWRLTVIRSSGSSRHPPSSRPTPGSRAISRTRSRSERMETYMLVSSRTATSGGS